MTTSKALTTSFNYYVTLATTPIYTYDDTHCNQSEFWSVIRDNITYGTSLTKYVRMLDIDNFQYISRGGNSGPTNLKQFVHGLLIEHGFILNGRDDKGVPPRLQAFDRSHAIKKVVYEFKRASLLFELENIVE